MIEITCERCGGKRKFYPADLRRGRGRFCSYKCRDEWLSEYALNNNGENHPRYIKKEMRRCKICGSEFKCLPSSKKTICSRKCNGKNLNNIYKNVHHATFKGGAYASTLRYHKKNPKKVRVWARVNYAKKHYGMKSLPCKVCGNPKTVAHHKDYRKIYDVIWLCRKHHVHLHKGIISI